jgi:NAD dependent epimerase/dehydratase family enzyme
MSWVALDDAVGVIHHALFTDGLQGPVNAVAPQSVTNSEYTRTLGRLLLASQRAVPKRLQETGYVFARPDLEGALRHQLGH